MQIQVRNHLIWIYTVCKGRTYLYLTSAGQGLKTGNCHICVSTDTKSNAFKHLHTKLSIKIKALYSITRKVQVIKRIQKKKKKKNLSISFHEIKYAFKSIEHAILTFSVHLQKKKKKKERKKEKKTVVIYYWNIILFKRQWMHWLTRRLIIIRWRQNKSCFSPKWFNDGEVMMSTT